MMDLGARSQRLSVAIPKVRGFCKRGHPAHVERAVSPPSHVKINFLSERDDGLLWLNHSVLFDNTVPPSDLRLLAGGAA
jgi:hypothetical protein